ncbi:Aldehyde dehydrogenase, dimeric NADP-preferring, partial [Quaeritorhiza haematococci]
MKEPLEAHGTEIGFTLSEIVSNIKNVEEWSRPETVSGDPLLNTFDNCEIRKQPLVPAASAIAAGNTVIMKPSEVSSHTALAISTLVAKYLDPRICTVVNGGIPETTALLNQRFDHIFYTGNGSVAKIIMTAAAKHLTPTVLELGGKSPAIVDKDNDLTVVAKRIMWGKTLNAGQTCIAPDYVLVHKSKTSELIEGAKKALWDFYGAQQVDKSKAKSAPTASDLDSINVQKASGFGRIINRHHFERLTSLLNAQLAVPGCQVAVGGKTDPDDLFISPTVVTGLKLEDFKSETSPADCKHPLMSGELFGPILPVVEYDDLDEAIAFVNKRDKPLAMYVFSRDRKVNEYVIERTSSGAVLANDLLMNMTVEALPFGGVGPSGMGAYHGKFGFDTFTHKRTTMTRPSGLELMNVPRYPPYGDLTAFLTKRVLLKKLPSEGSSWLSGLWRKVTSVVPVRVV